MKVQASIKSLTLILVVGCTLLFTSDLYSKDKVIYVIGVGTDGSNFKNNEGISVSGDKIIGSATIFINNFMDFFTRKCLYPTRRRNSVRNIHYR